MAGRRWAGKTSIAHDVLVMWGNGMIANIFHDILLSLMICACEEQVPTPASRMMS